jgi:GTP cyclohydrolase II
MILFDRNVQLQEECMTGDVFGAKRYQLMVTLTLLPLLKNM